MTILAHCRHPSDELTLGIRDSVKFKRYLACSLGSTPEEYQAFQAAAIWSGVDPADSQAIKHLASHFGR
jgi:hypothetical protein